MRIGQRSLGGVTFNASTKGADLHFRLDSDLASTSIHGQGQAQLTGEYPIRGGLTFQNIRYSNIAPFLSSQQAGPPPFEALVEGKATFNGQITDLDAMSAALQLDRVDLRNNTENSLTGAPRASRCRAAK